jgi:hypothetical protein
MKTFALLAVLAITLPSAVMSINAGTASTALPLPMSFTDFGAATPSAKPQKRTPSAARSM